ncbi:hypothetical protein HYE67_007696 [Fusarium culmorum]|uniref:Uncharacterized protein n=1 Tax=Fusarium culmorum TaxID=5516 RepID=A0A7S8DBG9_FUSCU|nr:hypothetical protein HYE67_007696 [Fusarium culmorum]
MSSLRPEPPEDESLFGSPVPESTLELPEDESLFGSPVPKPCPKLSNDESLFGSPIPESTLGLPEYESLFGSPVPKPSLIFPQGNKTAPEKSVPEPPTPESTPVVRGGIETGQPNRRKLKENVENALALKRITATPTFKFEGLSPEKQMLIVSQLKRFIKEEQERRDKKRQETQQSSTDAYVAYQKACWEKAKLRAKAKRMTARKTNGPLPGPQPQIPGQLNMPQDSIVPPAAINNNEDRGAVGAFDWFEGLERMY